MREGVFVLRTRLSYKKVKYYEDGETWWDVIETWAQQHKTASLPVTGVMVSDGETGKKKTVMEKISLPVTVE